MEKELLAPAGDIEAGYAALYYGADAVYLGLQKFSARATAANFSEENLNEFVGYAHSLGRKVFVAVNTLVQEDELPSLLEQLDICSRCGVDAVIIQDLGVARIVREQYPELEMHASTQMAVHNKEGALTLQKLGFSRVVVARELTLPEIKEIAEIPNLETEAFIHGALCYSYSGLCMFSSVESGKSANRGKCLYPCRSCFKSEEGEKHFFSMKDMALQADVLKMPVTSLKIEGRKKTALYVAAVTDYYRRILDGKGADVSREENIKQIFSRPWCEFHFKGRDKNVIDRDFVGHRGLFIGKIEQVDKKKLLFTPKNTIARYDGIQIDVDGEEKPFGFSVQGLRVNGKNVYEAKAGEKVEVFLPPKTPFLKKGQNVYLASSTQVKAAYKYEKPKSGEFKQRTGIDVEVVIEANKVKAGCGKYDAVAAGKWDKAEQPEKVAETVKKSFAKTGDTPFELRKLNVENKGGYFVPVSVLNELRRELYAKIEVSGKVSALPEQPAERKCGKAGWIVRTDKADCLTLIDLSDVAEVVYLLSEESRAEDLSSLPKGKVRLSLPAVCRQPEKFRNAINDFLAKGYKKWEAANYWALNVLPEFGIDLSFDYSLYMMNTQAVEMAREMRASRVTISPEDTLENVKKLARNSVLPVCFDVYQDVPLFTSAACIRSNPCKSCPRGEKWIDLSKSGKAYQALSKNCQTMLFAGEPLCFAREAAAIKADYYRVSFVYKTYSPEQALKIWKKVRSFEDVDGYRKANLERSGIF
ncbi:MAG: U32 family peptidase [Alphaproteobacteria bacterium]|nr:U32 family peptidase [Alphaproteobacteria bacterium]